MLGEKEAEAIVKVIEVFRTNGIAPKDMRVLFEKRGAAKKAGEAVEKAVDNIGALRAHCGMDGALFGRMITGSVVGRIDSCLLVAHALTVHPLQSVGDYFSVQDTLKDKLDFTDDAGASHTNSVELTSGLFYEYWVFDVRQALANFNGLAARDISGIIGWLTRAIHGLEPAAKRGSTAPFGNVPFFMVEVGRRQPRTLMDAFEKAMPFADSSKAVERLQAYRETANRRSGAPQAFLLEGAETTAFADTKELPLIEALSLQVQEYVESRVEELAKAIASRKVA